MNAGTLPTEDLPAVAATFTRAQRQYSQARRARAVAAWRAREAGATWGELAAALGVARNNLPDLVRLGAKLAEEGL